jgi:hypothetical protein
MRARNLKPSLFTNELLAVEDPLYSLIFAGLWCLADREGRLEDRPGKIHIAINPGRAYDGTQRALDWLAMNGFISRYSIGQARYIQVINFALHQNPHQKETPSKIPPPGASPVQAPGEPEAGTGQAPDNPPKRGGAARLIPDSGSLIPDSGSRIPDSSGPSPSARAERPDPNDVLAEIRPHYPAGLHREDHWTSALHHVARLLLAEGVPPETLLRNVRAYRDQQIAEGTVGSGKVLRPSTFFGTKAWQGPFDLPKSKAEARLEGNVAVMREFLAEGGAS